MKIWITGANGLLGKSIQNACRTKGIPFVATSKDNVDISASDQVNRFIESHSQNPFSHVMNCAALAHVDLAEKNPAAAFRVNVLGPENLGKAAGGKLKIIHFSTEYVFNGNPSNVPFKESDTPRPIGVYAVTKREGEVRLLAVSPKACVIRTSWLFGGEGKTFLSSLFNRIKSEKTLQIAADQKGRATYVEDLAAVVFFFFHHQGIFHFANQGETSRYEIGLAMRQFALEFGISIACEEIRPMRSEAFIQINKRPVSCILDTSKTEILQGHLIRSWKEAVKDLAEHSVSKETVCL